MHSVKHTVYNNIAHAFFRKFDTDFILAQEINMQF